MLITLFRCTAICQLVAEVWSTEVAPLRAVRHRFNFLKSILYLITSILAGVCSITHVAYSPPVCMQHHCRV